MKRQAPHHGRVRQTHVQVFQSYESEGTLVLGHEDETVSQACSLLTPPRSPHVSILICPFACRDLASQEADMTEPPAARGTFEKHHPFNGTFHSPLCTFYIRTTASIQHQSTMYPVLPGA